MPAAAGQMLLGHTSDRLGRKPFIVTGLLLMLPMYVSIFATRSYALILTGAAISGLGDALNAPARNAAYLDITGIRKRPRARISGIKNSAFSLGGVLGPLAVALAVRVMSPRAIFALSGGLLVFLRYWLWFWSRRTAPQGNGKFFGLADFG